MAVICCTLLPALALAYPTGLNIIPTADVLEPNSFRIEFENDGYSELFTGDSEYYLTAGVYVESKLGGGINIAVGFPNSGEGENLVFLNLSWTCSLQ